MFHHNFFLRVTGVDSKMMKIIIDEIYGEVYHLSDVTEALSLLEASKRLQVDEITVKCINHIVNVSLRLLEWIIFLNFRNQWSGKKEQLKLVRF